MQRTRDHHNFGYKDLDETMGPRVYDAPANVLDALTPTDNEFALEWRQQCRNNLAKRADARKRQQAITVGVVIQTAVPLHFPNGLNASRFECVERSGRTIRWHAITDDGTRFSLPSRHTVGSALPVGNRPGRGGLSTNAVLSHLRLADRYPELGTVSALSAVRPAGPD